MARQLLGAGAAALQRHQQARLHLRLGAGDLGLGEGLDRIVDDVDNHFHHLRRVARVGAGIEPEEAGVGIRRVECIDGVAQSALFAHLLEQPRRHSSADRVGEDLQREQRQVDLRHPFERQRQMRLLEFAMHHPGTALAERGRLRLRRGRRIETRKTLRHFLDHAPVIDRACRSHHHVGAAIMRGEIAAERIAAEALEGLGGTEQRTAHRLIRVTQLVEMLEHDIVGSILRGADLLHDHVLFALEFVRHEGRVGQDVGQHVERERHVGLHHPGVIGRGLGRGAGVEVAADRLDFLDDLARRAPRGALERHVFEQMRDAVLVRLLVATTDAGPDPKRRGFQMRHGVGDDGEAGRKLGDVDAHPATPCLAARLIDSTNRSTSA